MTGTAGHRLFTMALASVYPLDLATVQKGRTKDELDAVVRWLTGYAESELGRHRAEGTSFGDFFAGARLNPQTTLITSVICGLAAG